MKAFTIILVVIGNLLLFSGAIFNDLSDYFIAWIIVILTIIIDTMIIYQIMLDVLHTRANKRAQKEKDRIADVTHKTEAILHQYTPQEISYKKKAIPFTIDKKFVNKEIIHSIHIYKNQVDIIYKNYHFLTEKINKILSCSGCNTIDDKYAYLSANEELLKKLKHDINVYKRQLSSYKIELLNENPDLIFEVKLAFRYLLNSQKCVSANKGIKACLTSDKPDDLALFKFENDPVILILDEFYFCLFTNVILVFDNAGTFTTAVDPSALSIICTKAQTDVMIRNGTMASNPYISQDSRRISEGETYSKWQYACRDGTPDLRYSYNPLINYRTDIYEYTIVQITIAHCTNTFTVSSSVVYDTFQKIIPKYIRKCNNKHESIPDLLKLIEITSNDHNPQLDYILKTYAPEKKINHYFCQIITI